MKKYKVVYVKNGKKVKELRDLSIQEAQSISRNYNYPVNNQDYTYWLPQ